MAIDSGGGSGISEEDLFFEVAFGEGFESAVDFDTTADRILDATAFEREDVPPEVIQPWECRIGGCRFFIPPINIDVQQRYKTGSLTGSALRQPSSPKFNSGHTETVITMTLYFPTMESVFGVEDSIFDINFDENGNDKRIDRFLSSLRGLIAQFRYAPFLPIRNAYLNRVFDVTGVALKDMTISTVPNFPFCMAVTLTLYKFNHKVYLPMVEHFDQAVHWGRYRSFMGRAAIRMAQSAKPMKVWSDAMGEQIEAGQIDFPVKSSSTVLEDADQNYDQGSKFTFRKPAAADASLFEFYYPFQTPTRLEVPDLDDMRPEDPQLETRKRSWWENLLGVLGVETSVYPEAQYNTAREIAEDQGTGYYSGLNEDKILYNYLKRVDIAFKDMGPGRLEEYIKKRQDELDIPPGSGAAEELRVELTRLWFYTLMRFMLEDPSLAAALANENRRNRQITFDEWEIPLKKLNLDWNAVDVQGVAVTMGNVLSSLQLQLQGETTYQHIGGEDTRIDIELIISGPNAEDELVRLRTMFDSISGLARLAQNHGVLGFLGVKNLITELVGVRYAVPLNFNVNTVPNFPHAYKVQISLVDFDVFQQRREQLTAEQQAELIEAFGKNNPFLRLKQLWGHFNGYPDFPLAVRDGEGKIVGHLEPDFYFRAFKAIDDDLVTADKYERVRVDQTKKKRVKDALEQYDQGQKSWQEKRDDGSYMNESGNHINFGMVNGEPQVATVSDRGISLRSGNKTVMRDTPITEIHAGNNKESYVDGLAPPSTNTEPYAGGNSDPRDQFELMARDMQYRDKSGRMVRAFPTYMLWLIDEGGTFGGFKLFDNFYGLQSVIDMSIVRSEDIMADTLVLRLSNLYSKLSTNFSAYLGEENPASRIINEFTTRNLRILSGASEYMVELDTMRLKPGVRMHLRLGYGSNPNSLETVFNGTITDIQQGDIITVVAQSDAMELGAPVNNPQPLDSNILTPDGFKRMGDLKVGDCVMGSDGNPTKIVGISDRKIDDVYRVTFSDGSSTECTATHLWEVKAANNWRGESRVVPLSKVMERIYYEKPNGQKNYKFSVPLVAPVEFKAGIDDRVISPYIMGVLLGDGGLNGATVRVTTEDDYIIERFTRELPVGHYIFKDHGTDIAYRITKGVGGSAPNVVRRAIDDLGLRTTGEGKFVPESYKLGTIRDRIDLLHGLMDTDGTPDGCGASFSNKSRTLCEDLQWIVRSLGGFATISDKTINTTTLPQGGEAIAEYYRVYIRLPEDIDYFSLPRKREKRTKTDSTLTNKIVDVCWSRNTMVQCISVEASNGLYVTDDFRVTHNTNKDGHSGRIDGNLTGLYLSEPRDLMLALLTKGSSIVREVIAHATKGQIFSENRYGIKHFGLMKYTHMGAAERDKNDRQKETLSARVMENAEEGNGIVAQFFHTAMLTILNDAWVNLSTHRDYEIFKRNIYPGNGLGVGQFLGGDMGDVFETRGAFDGEKALVDGTGFGPGGEAQAIDPLTGSPIDIDTSLNREELREFNIEDPHYQETYKKQHQDDFERAGSNAPPPNAAFEHLRESEDKGFDSREYRPDLSGLLNITSRYDDDEIPEVSFRAQTYMKTVWDMFKICAALLPDYIVAVRPFEERSTIFYGKPHWLYTSGVIPLSKGVKPADAPPLAEPNEEWKKIYNDLEEQANRRDEMFKEDLIGAVKATAVGYQSGSDPSSSRDGMQFNGSKESILSLPTALSGGMQLPQSEGATGPEMHLPTSGNLQEDIAQHLQLDGLPENLRHPFYMDREGGPRGGYVTPTAYDPSKNPLKQSILPGENPDAPGKGGALGILDPKDEQWYMNMRWTGAGGGSSGWAKVWRHRRILVYCPKTNRAVVCTPAEYGPAKSEVQKGIVSGVSPDAWWALGQPKRGVDNCYYRVMSDDFPLGPIDDITGAASSTNTTSGPSASSVYDGGLVSGTDVPGREQVKMTTGKVDLPSWAEGYGAKSVDQIAFEEGWKVAGIPVNYTKAEGVEGTYVNEDGVPVDSGVNSTTTFIHYDQIGIQASQAYIHQVSEAEANDIWDEVRQHFADDSAGWVGKDQTVEIFNKWLEENDIEIDNKDELRRRLADGFLKYMWQRSHTRGWIPKVVHPAGDLSQTIIPGPIDPDLPGERDWNLAPVYDAFAAYLTGDVLTSDGGVIDNPNIENTKLEDFIRANQKDGYDQAGYLGKAVEAVGKRVHDVGSSVGRIAKALFTVGGGLLSYLRMSLFQVSHGLMLASSMQKNSNVLNNIYNDSIYFSAGVKDGKVENPLLFYADNPFTREYGEPVAEIREPFQRLHTINSIRHIVSNNIQESLNDVATVVTAVSNNADPVTVHFDKGIPSERQREITIETGLHYDDPGWLSWIWNPMSQAREWKQKGFLGFIGGEKVSPPELNAKRVALWHLKENLKDIYQGEVVVLGDPTIRPYDLVYMYDAYENISGFFEVEQVVHHFTPETGFITSITPNACVSINDPGRFYLWANRQRTESIDDVRTKIREVLRVRADSDPAGTGEEYLDIDVLEETLAKELTNSAQYFGGMGKVVGAMGTSWVVGGPIGAFVGWQMWQYVRDNLLDQHGCYINYLTRDGKPMDGGLSYNQGVAVGHQRSLGVMLGALKIGEISTIDQDGNSKIRTSEVIPALKWDEYGPSEYAREVDMFVDATLAEIRKQSGRGGDLIAEDSGVEVFWVRIVKVTDVDTFQIQLLEHMNFGKLAPAQNFALGDTIRLAGAQGVEDDYKNDELLSAIKIDDLGVQGTEFARTVLEGQEVALRVSRYKSFRIEKYGRTLAYVFHNAPESARTPEQRKSYLINVAGAQTPLTAWNSYTEDGKPHTFDWELIVRGFGDTYSGDLERSLPGHGVHGEAKDVIPRDQYGGESGGGIIR